jgi:antitoxin component YwqK of YwqJK toxin-antitoxin module
MIAACGSPQTAAPPEALPGQRPPRSTDVIPAPSLACPDGAVRVRAPLPERAVHCARADGSRHGPFAELYPDGSVAVLGTYADGELDGSWVRMRPDRRVAEEGQFKAGKRDGRWRQYDPDGGLLGEYRMKAGTGEERRWWDHGPLESATSWVGGVREGAAAAWAADGTQVLDERYHDGLLDGARTVGVRTSMFVSEQRSAGVRVGPREVWRRGYRVMAESFDSEGHLDGNFAAWRSRRRRRGQGADPARPPPPTWTWYDRGGGKEQEGGYVDGLRDGTWTTYRGRMVASIATYTMGEPDGAFIEYDSRGRELGRTMVRAGKGVIRTFHANRRVATVTPLVDGAPHGRHLAYDVQGHRIVDGRFDHGSRHGAWKHYWPTGKLRIEAQYKDGDLEGRWRRFSPRGSLEIDATYQAGMRQGPYVEYYADGSREVAGGFVDDKADGTWTQWQRGGKVAVRATWKDGALDGPWQETAADGTVTAGQHVAGRRTGTWTTTDRDGAVVRADDFSDPQ